jgi:hypothetical protein
MYLFTLGASLTHATYDSRLARTIIAALDRNELPVLSAHMQLTAGSV